jgi:hypothetical protein
MTEPDTASGLSASHDRDSRFGNINELVERWNHRAEISRRTDRENYINGDIKFLRTRS